MVFNRVHGCPDNKRKSIVSNLGVCHIVGNSLRGESDDTTISYDKGIIDKSQLRLKNLMQSFILR